MGFILADGGIETALVDRLGQTLPEFAAFVLLDSESGRAALRAYYEPFVRLAAEAHVPFACDTPTWRASSDWGDLLGYDAAALERVQHESVQLIRGLLQEIGGVLPATVSGCIGPRWDDYQADQRMTAAAARSYHEPQVRALAAAGVDRIVAVTMIDTHEAVGVVEAARAAGAAVAVSFTVGADGVLPSGSSLAHAISEVDSASGAYPVEFLINCAHPSEVLRAVQLRDNSELTEDAQAPLHRIGGVRLNAAVQGDGGAGDSPEEFGVAVARLCAVLPSIEFVGGCCGTDVPHIAAVSQSLATIKNVEKETQ